MEALEFLREAQRMCNEYACYDGCPIYEPKKIKRISKTILKELHIGRTRRLNMNNGQLIEKIYQIMLPITIYQMDGKPVPVKNTTRAECYKALWEINRLLFADATRRMIEVAKGLDPSKIFDDDLQHVGYTDEQLGREK